MRTNEFLTELSNDKLGQYKTAAGKDATAADKAGNFKRGNKRMSGITNATKKEFANDAKKVSESKQFVLNESLLMEDPIYCQFKAIGKYITERKLSKQEISQIFADAETGMTSKDTGANRTMLGRGKDVTGKAITSVKDAVSGVLNSIQNSVPVSAVDVAYDQATAALGKLTGGEKGKIMKSIIAYRNLAKQYPKTAGFAKAALVAAIGLATGGAGLPAVAGLTYALDSAIKGDKLSSVIGKGAGAAALAYGGQAAAQYAQGAGGADIPGANPHQLDPSQMQQGAGGADIPGANPHQLDPSQMQQGAGGADIPGANPHQLDPSQMQQAAGGYKEVIKTVAKGDTLSNIAQQYETSVEALMRANPQITNPDALAIGTKLNIPPVNADTYLQGVGTAADTAAKTASGAYDSVPAALGKQVAANRAGVTESIWKTHSPKRDKNIVESINFKKLSAYDLIDKKTTAFNWALNESIGNKTRNVNLTTLGVYTIFENVDRYRLAVMEADNLISADELERMRKGENPRASAPTAAPTTPAPAAPTSSAPATPKPARAPGSTRPEQYRPDQPGGKGKQSKPGLIGRGLNWLDKTAGKVGGALSNFGHQFTTKVTKEKLNMNWTQAGQPSDSDQLAAFMKKQGVPEDVISTVYTKMGLPFTMTPAAAAATTDATTGSTSTDTSGAGAGAFSSMANQLPKSTNTSSTGGTTTNTSTGLTHTSKAVAPTSGGAGGTSSAGSMSQPSEPNTPREQQAVTRTVRQQIDDIMHTILTQHNDDQPALVKYLRQRLDGSFPNADITAAASKRTAPKRAAPKGKKPNNTIAMPKREKFRVGKDEIKPGDPMYDKIKAAGGVTESLGLNYPETYEQTNDKFKSKGQRRVAALTNEQNYDSGDYSNARMGREYGKRNYSVDSGASHFEKERVKNEPGGELGRPRSLAGASKSLPADAFGRTTGKIPKGKTGQVHKVDMDEGKQRIDTRVKNYLPIKESAILQGLRG